MLRDRYDNPLTTASTAARDAYVAGVDLFLAAQPGAAERFEAAVEADPGFALGHSGLARARQLDGDPAGTRAAMDAALALADAGGLTAREAAHAAAMDHVVSGRGPQARDAVRAHVAEHPRDVLPAQTCTSVFGLIGFSGLPGREAEQLAYVEALAPHYGDDWWCLAMLAFARCEVGQLDRASAEVDRALELNPANAHAAHVRAHVDYEAGNALEGAAYLDRWMQGYDKTGTIHGHCAWHVALWSLEAGDEARLWRVVDADVAPDASVGPAINRLTDMASILFRAELAGVTADPARWRAVSAYAAAAFPTPGLAFADAHAALAHAMAGETEALRRVAEGAAGPAAPVVRACAAAFEAMAAQDWPGAAQALTEALQDHARLGGSRAQRDLGELAMAAVLLRMGRGEEARRMLAMRRPAMAAGQVVAGL
ncbi:MAG: tetratricopeptide repeat protein [Pseudomonadota bacterium]